MDIEQRRGLWRAAKTASVSYRIEINPEALRRVLTSGQVPPEFIAHIAHLLGESPIPIVVAAVAEAAERENVPRHEVWRNVAKLAAMLGISRQFDNSTES